MTDENVAWEQFQKADATNLEQASAAGMLQAIMAELSSVKADTARLAQKLPDAGADAGSDELAQEDTEMGGGMMPPMDGGAPPMDAGAPPMDEGGAPSPMEGLGAQPMGGDDSISGEDLEEGEGMGGLGDMSDEDKANLSAMFSQDLVPDPMEMDQGAAGGEVEQDETLDALQDALTRVKDPEAIAKLADIIKEYVMSNAGELEAEAHPEAAAGAGDMPPEALLAALAGGAPDMGGAEAMPGADGDVDPSMLIDALGGGAEGGAPMPDAGDVPPELLEGLMKSDDNAKKVEEERDVVTTDGKIDATPGTTDIAASSTDDDECCKGEAPCITITITVGELLESPMSKLFDTNQEDGTTPKDLDKDKKFESFEAACKTEPVKRSIDDLMNQNLRGRRGANGEFYKISKSATEIANERTLSVRKSLSSLNSVADMRVGDVLKSMWGLRQMGVTNLEKTYEPLIDEVVKYCDNHVGPQYTEPLFRSFGVDISKMYDPLPTSTFIKGIFAPNSVSYNPNEYFTPALALLYANHIMTGEAENRKINSRDKLGSGSTNLMYGINGDSSFERDAYRLMQAANYLKGEGKNTFSLNERTAMDDNIAPVAVARLLENRGYRGMWNNPLYTTTYQNLLSAYMPNSSNLSSLVNAFNKEYDRLEAKRKDLESSQNSTPANTLGSTAGGSGVADDLVKSTKDKIQAIVDLQTALKGAVGDIKNNYTKEGALQSYLSPGQLYADIQAQSQNEPNNSDMWDAITKVYSQGSPSMDDAVMGMYKNVLGRTDNATAADIYKNIQDTLDARNYRDKDSNKMLNWAERYARARKYAKNNGDSIGISSLAPKFVYSGGTFAPSAEEARDLLRQVSATLDIERQMGRNNKQSYGPTLQTAFTVGGANNSGSTTSTGAGAGSTTSTGAGAGSTTSTGAGAGSTTSTGAGAGSTTAKNPRQFNPKGGKYGSP